MAKALEQLPLSYQEKQRTKNADAGPEKALSELTDKLTVFLNSGNAICWMEKGRTGQACLCAVQWNWNRFYSVTSGAD